MDSNQLHTYAVDNFCNAPAGPADLILIQQIHPQDHQGDQVQEWAYLYPQDHELES